MNVEQKAPKRRANPRNRYAFILLVAASSTSAHAQQVMDGPRTAADGAQQSLPASIRPASPGTPQLGIGGTPERPGRAVLRSDEDWSWVDGLPEPDRQPLDRYKYVPLTYDGSTFVTLGFDGRTGLEYFSDGSWGDNPGDDATFHSRANPHVSLTIADRLRFYGALKFGSVEGSKFTPSPADDDGPDVHQLFGELSFGDVFGLPTKDVFVRAGRQELHYGAGRLVSIRNGPNVRFDFNGLTSRARIGSTVAEALYVRPSENDPGGFDNGVDENQALWGLYTSTALGGFSADPAGLLAQSNLDLYYLGFDRESSTYAFQSAPLDESRHTIGTRFWTGGPPNAGWSLDLEAGYQFGEARGIISAAGPVDADISAGFAAGIVTYGFDDLPWSPVIGSRFGISSGDADPGDDLLTTFRGPFPPGRYFGESNPIGPGNVAGIGPSIAVTPFEKLTLTGRYQAFWRVETEDGLYSPPQIPLRMPAGNDRYVGQEFALTANYALDNYTSLNATIARFDAGAFLADSGPSEDITYFDFKLAFSF